MKRVAILVPVSLALASAVSAASLSLNVFPRHVEPGGRVVIEIIGQVEADDPIRFGIDVRLVTQGGGGIEWTGATQRPLTVSFASGDEVEWVPFAPICAGSDPCVAINQGNPVLPMGWPADPFTGVIATATGIFGPSGQLRVSTQSNGTFFGAADVTFHFTMPPPPPIPEPSTAALLALGLVALAFARFQRRPRQVESL